MAGFHNVDSLGTSEVAEWRKVFAAKPEDLVSWTHMGGRANQLLQVAL